MTIQSAAVSVGTTATALNAAESAGSELAAEAPLAERVEALEEALLPEG